VLESLSITISHVLLTHWHSDHTGGVPHFIEYRPEYSDRIYKSNPARDQKEIYDGQVFSVEGATVRAVFTPGHSHDHMCFKLDEENSLFTGDNVLGHGQSVFEDLGLFTKSLSIMADLGCQLGYPGHGDIIRNLPRKMQEIVKQREYHERQICETLTMSKSKATLGGFKSKGSLSIPGIARELYGAVKPEVYKLAIEPSLTGTLGKLAEDRKVAFEVVNGEKQWFIRERYARQVANKFLKQSSFDAAATS
jgi:hydrolase